MINTKKRNIILALFVLLLVGVIASQVARASDQPLTPFQSPMSPPTSAGGGSGGGGGGTVTGTGAATQVAFWTSATNISGSNNFTYSGTAVDVAVPVTITTAATFPASYSLTTDNGILDNYGDVEAINTRGTAEYAVVVASDSGNGGIGVIDGFGTTNTLMFGAVAMAGGAALQLSSSTASTNRVIEIGGTTPTFWILMATSEVMKATTTLTELATNGTPIFTSTTALMTEHIPITITNAIAFPGDYSLTTDNGINDTYGSIQSSNAIAGSYADIGAIGNGAASRADIIGYGTAFPGSIAGFAYAGAASMYLHGVVGTGVNLIESSTAPTFAIVHLNSMIEQATATLHQLATAGTVGLSLTTTSATLPLNTTFSAKTIYASQDVACAAGVLALDPSGVGNINIDANGAACVVTLAETSATVGTSVLITITTSAGAGLVTFPDVAGVHLGPTLCTTTGIPIGSVYRLHYAKTLNEWVGEECQVNQ